MIIATINSRWPIPRLYLDIKAGTRILPEGTHWDVQVPVTWNKELYGDARLGVEIGAVQPENTPKTEAGWERLEAQWPRGPEL